MNVFNEDNSWEVINEFTLRRISAEGRKYGVNCVPQLVTFELHNLKAVFGVQHFYGELVKSKSLVANALTSDSICMFSLSEGLLGTMHEFEIIIAPAGDGFLGSHNDYKDFDSINYTGMGAADAVVPPDGLFKGEVGRLHAEEKEILLYLDRKYFDELFDQVISLDRPMVATARVLIELFVDEIEAALAEPWIKQTYGLLVGEGGKPRSPRARFASINIDSGIQNEFAHFQVETGKGGGGEVVANNSALRRGSVDLFELHQAMHATLQKVLDFQGYILVALIFGIFAVLGRIW